MKYLILSTDNPEHLEQLVNREISNGWIPIGGVCVNEHYRPNLQNEDKAQWAQAMTTQLEHP